MARKKINAEVRCWHASGMSGSVVEVADITTLRIKLPGLDWLHSVEVYADARTGQLRVSVQSTSDDDDANAPTLTVTPSGRFTVDS